MNPTNPHKRNYLIAAIFGAVGGGLFVAITTKAIPKIMQAMMSNMMQDMMGQMGEAGCDPAEI